MATAVVVQVPEPADRGVVGIVKDDGAGQVPGGIVGSSSVDRANGAVVAVGVAVVGRSGIAGRRGAVATAAVPVPERGDRGVVGIAEADGAGEVSRRVVGPSSVDRAKGAVIAAGLAGRRVAVAAAFVPVAENQQQQSNRSRPWRAYVMALPLQCRSR